ncbi:hypothetical protein J27TS7_00670 [Paenibacillus dendritiformis]|nr:hypothetical protein J27TS7_00670 [Paenibacillus dendritiformis]
MEELGSEPHDEAIKELNRSIQALQRDGSECATAKRNNYEGKHTGTVDKMGLTRTWASARRELF